MKKIFKLIFSEKTRNRIKLFFKIPLESKDITKKREDFYSQFINKKDLVFDVGANYGNRTLPLLNIGSKVVAVEPQKICIDFLKRRFGKKIEIVKMGLGEKEEIKDFFVASVNTISSFSKDWIDSVKENRFKDYSWSKPIKIQITTLDKVIEEYGLPKFIKIDVEGYELEVLKGLTKPINIISFEYTVPEQVQKAIDCISQIQKSNFNIECNYSVGESMDFELNQWMTADDFKSFILTNDFIKTDFGDIYIRTKSNS